MLGFRSRLLLESLAKFFSALLLAVPGPFAWLGGALLLLRAPTPKENADLPSAPHWIALRECAIGLAMAMGLLLGVNAARLPLEWLWVVLAVGAQLGSLPGKNAFGGFEAVRSPFALARNLAAWALLGVAVVGCFSRLGTQGQLEFALAALAASLIPLWMAMRNGEPGWILPGAILLAAGASLGQAPLAGAGFGLLIGPALTLVFHQRQSVWLRSAVVALGGVAGLLLPSLGSSVAGWLLVLLSFEAWRYTVRMSMFIFLHGIYRFRVYGRQHAPARGAALLISNHVTLVDGFLLAAHTQRHVRFLVFDAYFHKPLTRFGLELFRAIPIAQGAKREAIESLRAARTEIERGHVAGVFPEGSVTRSGHMNGFQKGFTRMLSGSEIPIVPAYMNGLWTSLLSFGEGRVTLRVPRFFRDLEVEYGAPLPPTTSPADLWHAVKHLETRAAFRDALKLGTLGERFVRVAVENWTRAAVESPERTLTYGELAMEAIVLAEALTRKYPRKQRVAVGREAGADTVILQVALAISGHLAVPEEFAGEGDVPAGAWRKLRRELDLQDRVASRILGWASVGLLLRRANGFAATPDSPVTVVEGREVPVVLSHRGTLAAVDQLRKTLWWKKGVRVRSQLGCARATGWALGLWLPLLNGATLVTGSGRVDFEVASPAAEVDASQAIRVYRVGEALLEGAAEDLPALEVPELSGVLAISTPPVTFSNDTQSGVKARTFGKLPFGVEAQKTEAGLRVASPARYLRYLDDGTLAKNFRLDQAFVLPVGVTVSDQGFVTPDAT